MKEPLPKLNKKYNKKKKSDKEKDILLMNVQNDPFYIMKSQLHQIKKISVLGWPEIIDKLEIDQDKQYEKEFIKVN